MCGRYLLTASPEEIAALFGYLDGEDFPPRYNIAPTQPIAIVRMWERSRRFALVRWGLVPRWVKDPGQFSLLINARGETLTDKPAFRDAVRYRRCLVPSSGFYEWRREPGGGKVPFWIKPRSGAPLAMAGLWETWAGADGSEIDSGCIVTTGANTDVAPVHHRMPVVIDPADFDIWLGGSTEEALSLVGPARDGLLEIARISTRVNSARNDDPSVLEPERDLFG
jgi:putative SOS response-associated peptidase YedK